MPDNLQDEIKKLAEKIPGCHYVSLVGYDGISVAQYALGTGFDVSLYDAEICSLMTTSRDIKDNLSLGAETELIWLTQNLFFIIHPLSSEFFIYACLRNTNSNPGLARIELNKAKTIINQIIYPA